MTGAARDDPLYDGASAWSKTWENVVKHTPLPPREPKWPGLTTTQSLAVASQFGVSLAVSVGLGLVAGQWLDGQLHTGLVFTLIGVLVGLIAGITGVVALYRATLRSEELVWRGRALSSSSRSVGGASDGDGTVHRMMAHQGGAANKSSAAPRQTGAQAVPFIHDGVDDGHDRRGEERAGQR